MLDHMGYSRGDNEVMRSGQRGAGVVWIADFEALEEFEMVQDVAAYREAKANDDGQRVSLNELRAEPLP